MAESDEQYDALGAVCERAEHIPTGLVVLVPNPEPDWELYAEYGRYGYRITPTGPMNVKQPVTVHVLGDPPFDFDSFYRERGAGLTGVTRQPTATPDEGEFWDAPRKCPSSGVFTAVRAGS
jgi:hypothetical protein